MHRFMNGLARLMAVLGGLVLTALIFVICVSVLGRALNTLLHSGPVVAVLGDFVRSPAVMRPSTSSPPVCRSR